MGKLLDINYLLLLALWALPVVGLIPIFATFYSKVTPFSIGQRLNNMPAGEIWGSLTVGQTFYSPYPGLYRIDVLLATYKRSNSGKVTFNLTPGPADRTRLVSIQFDASQAEDNRYRSFEFPPLDDSAGKTYFFYFEAPASRPGNAITAWTDATNPYPEGMAYVGGRPVENDLAFFAQFRPNPWQAVDVYLDQIARGKPGIWGSKAFYVVTFLVYMALVEVFLTLLLRKALGESRQ